MIRIGIGYDSHRFAPGRPFILGGQRIAFEQGLLGHSDADAVAHAVTDAILGASAAGDMGALFPDSDPRWKDADSLVLLRLAREHINRLGFHPLQADVTIVCERPRLGVYKEAMALAERRFRPGFRAAFDAWRATKPETNPNAPRGPTYMPQYRQPGLAKAKSLDKQADEAFAAGATAGERSDKYVRTTVFLASVLFLVGISTHFPVRGVRYALVGLGTVLLVVSLVQLTQLPGPPT